MGWAPEAMGGKEILILSTHGGVRNPDGSAVALGYHTGHWEVGLLVEAAAHELKALRAVPFAGRAPTRATGAPTAPPGCSTASPIATTPPRCSAAHPLAATRSGVIGVATCDKGLPAMMMALAAMHDLPCVLVPGGVTLQAENAEDAGRVQSVGARFAHQQITLEYAAENLCHTCATPGGGCQFLGTAATSQVVGEALGLSLTHAALSPSGHPIWLDLARRSARAVLALEARGMTTRNILTDASIRNAMVVHAAFGGSTNLILHLPAIAHAAKLKRPRVEDWTEVNARCPAW